MSLELVVSILTIAYKLQESHKLKYLIQYMTGLASIRESLNVFKKSVCNIFTKVDNGPDKSLEVLLMW